jgi:foldase protein PrsA
MTLEVYKQAYGLSEEALRENIRMQIIIEKLVGKDIQITDEEITQYFEENKELYEEGATLESMKETIKEQLFSQKLETKFQEWLASVKEGAKIEYVKTY